MSIVPSTRSLLQRNVCQCFQKASSSSGLAYTSHKASVNSNVSAASSLVKSSNFHSLTSRSYQNSLPTSQYAPWAPPASKGKGTGQPSTPNPLYSAINSEKTKTETVDSAPFANVEALLKSGKAGEELETQRQRTRSSRPQEPQSGSLQWLNQRFTEASELYSPAGQGSMKPCTPTSSRSINVNNSADFARSYRRLLSGVIMVNNIKGELKLQERYEKPKFKRQRLASARHRRRFAREIGLKVAAVMKAKRQGM